MQLKYPNWPFTAPFLGYRADQREYLLPNPPPHLHLSILSEQNGKAKQQSHFEVVSGSSAQ